MEAVLGTIFGIALLMAAFAIGQGIRTADISADCKRFGATSLHGVVYECKVRP